jgi:hypothetical protein
LSNFDFDFDFFLCAFLKNETCLIQLNLLKQSVWETNRVRPKSTSTIASHSRQAINKFRQSKPFHSGYNRLPRVQAITASSTKPTSSIPSYSGKAKTYFLLFKPFQSYQKGIPLFQAIPERPKSKSDIPSHYRQAKTDIRQSNPFKSGQN